MLINLSERKRKIKCYAINRKTKERVTVTLVDFASKECFITIPLEEKNGVKYNIPEWQNYSHRFDWELFMEID